MTQAEWIMSQKWIIYISQHHLLLHLFNVIDFFFFCYRISQQETVMVLDRGVNDQKHIFYFTLRFSEGVKMFINELITSALSNKQKIEMLIA